jgi:hypothetical protein
VHNDVTWLDARKECLSSHRHGTINNWKAKSGGEVEAFLEAFFVGRPSPF